jgi:hypothetical protein
MMNVASAEMESPHISSFSGQRPFSNLMRAEGQMIQLFILSSIGHNVFVQSSLRSWLV